MPALWTHHYPKNGWRIFSFHCYTMHCTYSLPLHLYPDQLSRLVVTARYLLILVQKYKIISSHLVGVHRDPSLKFSWLMHMLSHRRRNRGGQGGHGPPTIWLTSGPESPKIQPLNRQFSKNIQFSWINSYKLSSGWLTARSTAKKSCLSVLTVSLMQKWAWFERNVGVVKNFARTSRANMTIAPSTFNMFLCLCI